MTRYKAIVEYDGTNFSGWQRQKEFVSGQSIVEDAILGFCQEKVNVQCSGRTDAGVHARGQVVHFDLATDRDTRSVMHGINFHMATQPVVLLSVEAVDSEFHARFDAKKRYYRYHIINREAPLVLDENRAWVVHQKLDVNAMREAAQHLIGQHDFTTFRASACQAKSPIKTMDKIEFSQLGENIFIDIEALSFLHHMVRNVVGTLQMVGQGKWIPEDVKTALEAKNRTAGGPTAPACGLYFIKVDY
jgi:tRNA pseudouridine38-40 synthase